MREARSVADIAARLATTPIAIGLNASCSAFRFYSSGIITYAQCPGGNMDHSNSVVGAIAGNDTCTKANDWACDAVAEGGSYYWLV